MSRGGWYGEEHRAFHTPGRLHSKYHHRWMLLRVVNKTSYSRKYLMFMLWRHPNGGLWEVFVFSPCSWRKLSSARPKIVAILRGRRFPHSKDGNVSGSLHLMTSPTQDGIDFRVGRRCSRKQKSKKSLEKETHTGSYGRKRKFAARRLVVLRKTVIICPSLTMHWERTLKPSLLLVFLKWANNRRLLREKIGKSQSELAESKATMSLSFRLMSQIILWLLNCLLQSRGCYSDVFLFERDFASSIVKLRWTIWNGRIPHSHFSPCF